MSIASYYTVPMEAGTTGQSFQISDYDQETVVEEEGACADTESIVTAYVIRRYCMRNTSVVNEVF